MTFDLDADIKQLIAQDKKRQQLIEEGRDQKLLDTIKERLPELEDLFKRRSGADHVYRYYHHSFKVYYAQKSTLEMVELFKSIAPDLPLNENFMDIVEEGTGIKWEHEHNARWKEVTLPILHTFLHVRSMLELMIACGKRLEEAPRMLPIDWAAVLYLYRLR